MMALLLIILLIIIIYLIIKLIIKISKLIIKISKIRFKDIEIKSERRIAGDLGEKKAALIIERIIDEDDKLLRNVTIRYEDKETELDNVIVSKRGVFIIEVKNYKGELEGDEDSYEWDKYNYSKNGNIYLKKVKNPIKQIKRQIYILKSFLKYYGIDIWVDGYVYLLNFNSPVSNDYILENIDEMDRVLHKKVDRYLKKDTVNRIIELLQNWLTFIYPDKLYLW